MADDSTTVHRPRFEVASRPPAAFTLEVTEGPDRGVRFVLDAAAPGPALIGQSPACTVRLTDREVSRRHATLDFDEERLRVTDLKSTNGTFVDGIAVLDAFVRSGQNVRLGATTLHLTRVASTSAALARSEGFGRLMGGSFEMRRLYPFFEQLAASPLPLLIEGETGTGKELLAETLHARGPRADAPFVVFDCATAPHAQLEVELFGVDGDSARPGLFELARGGTLLFDEIAELDVQLQPKLLRAIERGEITPVGSRRARPVDVRIMAATQNDLDHAIQVGRFREDLYHRLVVARVSLPPLRSRRGDVELLAAHFQHELGDASRLPPLLLSRWLDHAWPGNVRELKNAVARYVSFGEHSAITAAEVPSVETLGDDARLDEYVRVAVQADTPLAAARQEVVKIYERMYVERLVEKHGGNVSRAASAAGVDRRYLQILRARSKKG